MPRGTTLFPQVGLLRILASNSRWAREESHPGSERLPGAVSLAFRLGVTPALRLHPGCDMFGGWRLYPDGTSSGRRPWGALRLRPVWGRRAFRSGFWDAPARG